MQTGNIQELLSPPFNSLFDHVCIHPASPQCLGRELAAAQSAGAASATFTANLLVCLPLLTAEALVVSQFFWHNGSAVDGNTDVGIYTLDGATKLVSTGATLNAGTSQIQTVNVADFILSPNTRYWLVLGCDSSTQTFRRWATVTTGLDLFGVKQQAAGWSSGLPTGLTLGIPSVAHTPVFGFTSKAVI